MKNCLSFSPAAEHEADYWYLYQDTDSASRSWVMMRDPQLQVSDKWDFCLFEFLTKREIILTKDGGTMSFKISPKKKHHMSKWADAITSPHYIQCACVFVREK